jgi:uncharacterized protein (TIGR00266 family)
MPSDIIDYELLGDDMQMVVITLDPQEAVLAEAGAMCYMSSGIHMDTRMDPHGEGGFFGSLFKAGKRMLTGESFFITVFTCTSNQREEVAFAAPYPGKIVPFDLTEFGGKILCQKDAYLCSARGVDVDIEFTKKLGTGFFGGEGFILQRLTGDGLAFIHAGGTIIPIDLEAGQTLRVDTGCLVAFTPSVNYDIKYVGGIKTGSSVVRACSSPTDRAGAGVAAIAPLQPVGGPGDRQCAAGGRKPSRRRQHPGRSGAD